MNMKRKSCYICPMGIWEIVVTIEATIQMSSFPMETESALQRV